MAVYMMLYFDRRAKVAAFEEYDASDDGVALKLAADREWSGSYEVRQGARAVYAYVGQRRIAGRSESGELSQ
jgi:hypothetical protein